MSNPNLSFTQRFSPFYQEPKKERPYVQESRTGATRNQIFPDNNRVLATLFAETASQPREGQQAVFDVVRNRSNRRGTSWDQEVSRPRQFEALGNPMYQQAMRQAGGENVFNGDTLDSYNRIRSLMEQDGPDTIGGASLYLNPKMQIAMGRKIPMWASDPAYKRATIGDHEFYYDR